MTPYCQPLSSMMLLMPILAQIQVFKFLDSATSGLSFAPNYLSSMSSEYPTEGKWGLMHILLIPMQRSRNNQPKPCRVLLDLQVSSCAPLVCSFQTTMNEITVSFMHCVKIARNDWKEVPIRIFAPSSLLFRLLLMRIWFWLLESNALLTEVPSASYCFEAFWYCRSAEIWWIHHRCTDSMYPKNALEAGGQRSWEGYQSEEGSY